jgi:hypothetical protein
LSTIRTLYSCSTAVSTAATPTTPTAVEEVVGVVGTFRTVGASVGASVLDAVHELQ